MIRFVRELHTHPEIPVKGAANSQLGKRLVSMFSKAKLSSNQVRHKILDNKIFSFFFA